MSVSRGIDWTDFEVDLGEPAAPATVATAERANVAVPSPGSGIEASDVHRWRAPLRTAQRNCLYIDIETVPDESRLATFGLPPVAEPLPETDHSQCPSPDEALKGSLDSIGDQLRRLNPVDAWLTDLLAAEQRSAKPRSGVKAAVDKLLADRAARLGAVDERRKLLSVTPEYCRIVALGWAVGSDRASSWTCGEHPEHTHKDERALLREFWRLAALHLPVIGFNLLQFDLPTLFFRSALLGVPASKLFDLKPWGKDVVDLMAVRFSKGRAMKLKELAPACGIAVPAGDMDGSKVGAVWESDPVKLGEYVRSDVDVSRALHRFYTGYFCV